jgi:hypothetical protein
MLLHNVAEAAPVLHARAMASDDNEFLLHYVSVIQRKALPNEGQVSVESVRDRMRATLAVIRDEASPELADHLSALIEPLWR